MSGGHTGRSSYQVTHLHQSDTNIWTKGYERSILPTTRVQDVLLAIESRQTETGYSWGSLPRKNSEHTKELCQPHICFFLLHRIRSLTVEQKDTLQTQSKERQCDSIKFKEPHHDLPAWVVPILSHDTPLPPHNTTGTRTIPLHRPVVPAADEFADHHLYLGNGWCWSIQME